MKKEKLPEPLLAKSHQKSMWMKGRIPTALVWGLSKWIKMEQGAYTRNIKKVNPRLLCSALFLSYPSLGGEIRDKRGDIATRGLTCSMKKTRAVRRKDWKTGGCRWKLCNWVEFTRTSHEWWLGLKFLMGFWRLCYRWGLEMFLSLCEDLKGFGNYIKFEGYAIFFKKSNYFLRNWLIYVKKKLSNFFLNFKFFYNSAINSN